jgi:SPP1 family predicted phage head-tail adaptor
MISAGNLRHRVSFQRPTSSEGATGQPETDWETVASVYAAFRTLGGAERTASQQVGATLTHEVTIHYDPALTIVPTWRLVYGTRIFDIKDVRNVDERNVELRLRCVEVVA